MKAHLLREKLVRNWSADIFPRNLPRVRGEEGLILDLAVRDGQFTDRAASGLAVSQRQLEVLDDSLAFDGIKSALRIPFDPSIDPAGWPFRIDVTVKAESDGVIAAQFDPRLWLQVVYPGRPAGFLRPLQDLDSDNNDD
jgi:hypothetical protein